MGRRGIRRKQLQDDHKGKIEYVKMKEAALNLTIYNAVWKTLWTGRKTDTE